MGVGTWYLRLISGMGKGLGRGEPLASQATLFHSQLLSAEEVAHRLFKLHLFESELLGLVLFLELCRRIGRRALVLADITSLGTKRRSSSMNNSSALAKREALSRLETPAGRKRPPG